MKYIKLLSILSLLFCFQLSIAQKSTDSNLQESEGYDVILVAGQSNTHYGYQLNKAIDTVSSRVYSIYRLDGLNYRIAPAKVALDFWTRANDRVSFSTTFSNLYVNDILKNSKRKVLIVPCGYSGSSITSWTKNQNLYKDAIERVNYLLDNIPGSRLTAILWHQGEANVGWAPYQTTLDQMIADMRSDIHQDDIQEIPFILGGMVPYWANYRADRKQQQQIIKGTPDRVMNTGYADSESPSVISKPNNNFDDIHFDAAGQREMGARYYNEFLKMQKLALGLKINRYHEVQYQIDSAKTIAVDKIDVTANKNLKSGIVYDSTGTKVLEVENLTANKFSIEVDKLPLSDAPYKLQIIDSYNLTHDYKFFR
jgi:hypothetical protein